MIQTDTYLCFCYGPGIRHINLGMGQPVIEDGYFKIIGEKRLLRIHNQISLHIIIKSKINGFGIGIIDPDEISTSVQGRNVPRSHGNTDHGISVQAQGTLVIKGLRGQFLMSQIQVQR